MPMSEIKFTVNGECGGEKLYELRVNGKIVSRGLTIDEVVRLINRADEEALGGRHITTPEDRAPRHSRR